MSQLLPLAPFLFALLLAPTAADPAAPPAPSRFTLQGRKPLGAVLDALAQQTGVRVDCGRGLAAEAVVSIDLKDVTFWQAVDAIAAAADARVYLYPSRGRVTLLPRPPGYRPPPVSYDGLFRTTIRKVTVARDLEGGPHACKAVFEVAWEPTLQPFLLETQPHGLRLEDGAGRPVATLPGGSSEAPVDGRISLVFDVSLPALPRSAPAIGLLEGRLAVVGPSKMLTFALGTLDALQRADADGPGRRQVLDGVTCAVPRVTLSEQRWTVQIRLDYPPGNKRLDSYQSWVVNNEMALESKDGRRRLVSNRYVLRSSSSRHALIDYHFDPKTAGGKPADWKVRYRTPARVIAIPFRFRFRDIPLP